MRMPSEEPLMNVGAIGRTVRWARKRAGLTQHELARAVGMPQPSVVRIERGTVVPRADTLMALLRATGHQLAVEPIGPSVDPEAIRRRLRKSAPARTWEALGGQRVAGNPKTSPITILRRLRSFSVPFVLIGDLAEVAHGSPARVDRIVEICHPPTDTARERLAVTLDELGRTSGSDGRSITTPAGRLNTTTETEAGDDYEILVRTAVRMPVDAGVLVQVASLEDLIRIRRARGAPADLQAAAVLSAIAGGD
jgi:transcriptional regulator with XRE-family HTH domain